MRKSSFNYSFSNNLIRYSIEKFFILYCLLCFFVFEKDIVILNFYTIVSVKMNIICSRFASASYNIFNPKKHRYSTDFSKCSYRSLYTDYITLQNATAFVPRGTCPIVVKMTKEPTGQLPQKILRQ